MKKVALSTVFLMCLFASPMAVASEFCAKYDTKLAKLYDGLWQNSAYVNDNEREFERYSASFEKQLKEVLSQKQALNCRFDALNKSGVSTYRSGDGRLQVFSWDLGTGGTMHESAMAIHYVGSDGKVRHHIQSHAPFVLGLVKLSVPVKSGRSSVYALHTQFIGSNMLHGQGIRLIQINGKALTKPKLIATKEGRTSDIGIAYNRFSLEDDQQEVISINPSSNTFAIAVVDENDGEFVDGKVTNQKDVYRFDGKVFKLAE